MIDGIFFSPPLLQGEGREPQDTGVCKKVPRLFCGNTFDLPKLAPIFCCYSAKKNLLHSIPASGEKCTTFVLPLPPSFRWLLCFACSQVFPFLLGRSESLVKDCGMYYRPVKLDAVLETHSRANDFNLGHGWVPAPALGFLAASGKSEQDFHQFFEQAGFFDDDRKLWGFWWLGHDLFFAAKMMIEWVAHNNDKAQGQNAHSGDLLYHNVQDSRFFLYIL